MSARLASLLGGEPGEEPGWLLTAIVFVLAAVPRLTSLRAFIAHDETLYWEWARTFFFALLKGDWLGTIVGPGNPSITLFWNQVFNMGIKYAWAWLTGTQSTALSTWPDFQPQAAFDLLIERRLPIVLFNTLAVALAYRLIHRLYGRRVALLAAVLLALDPFYLADSRTSRGEGLLASLMLLAILLFLSYWVLKRSRYLVLSGVAVGLALLTKTSAIGLVIWGILTTPVLSCIEPDISGSRRLRRTLRVWGLWGILVVITFWVLWPAMWVSPAKSLGFLLSFVSDVGVSGRDNFFFGQVYHDEALPFYYVIVYILRVTPLAWLGLLAGFAYLASSYFRPVRPEFRTSVKLRPLLTALILTFPLIYGLLITLGTLKRDWYLLPVFPALDAVSAVGLTWGFQQAWARWGGRLPGQVPPRAVWAGGLAAVLMFQAATALPAHPYYYTYWNPMVLGRRWAAQAVMVGWDLDLSAGAHYLNSKPHAEDLRAATRSTRGFQQIFKGHTVRWVPGQPWVQADYLVVRRNHLQLEKLGSDLLDYVSHLKLDHIVNIGGVDYLWIYEGPRAEYFAGPSELAGKATLLGYDVDDPETPAGDPLAIKLYWKNQGMNAGDELFWRLVDAGGYVWAEATASPLPDFEEAALTSDRIVESRATLGVPLGTPPGTYFFDSGIYSHAREEVLGYFALPSDGDKITVIRPRITPPVAHLSIKNRLDIRMSPEVSLLGFDLNDGTLVSSDSNWLTLYWQADVDVGKDYVMGLELLSPDGDEITYWLGRPVMGGYPTGKWEAGEIVRDPWSLRLPDGIAPGSYALQLSLFDAETQAAVNQIKLGAVSVAGRRRAFDVPLMQEMIDADLGDQLTLLGYDLFTEPIMGGGRLRITLYWQAQKAMDISYKVFVHLIDPRGTLVAQHDGVPAEDMIPTDGWYVGEVVADRHLVEFPDLPAGEYRLVVGMYDSRTGERLPVSGGDTTVLLQSILIGEAAR